MSKEFTKRLIKEWLEDPSQKVRYDDAMRRISYRGNPHIIYFSRKDLKLTFVDGIVFALSNKKEYNDKLQDIKPVISKIRALGAATAEHIFTKYKDLAIKGHAPPIMVGELIEFRQAQLSAQTLTNNMADMAHAFITANYTKYLPEDARNKVLTNDATRKTLSVRAQFHHEGETTVGSFMTARILHGLYNSTIKDRFLRKNQAVIAKTFEQFFGPILIKWGKFDSAGKYRMDETTVVRGRIGPRSQNSAGDQSTDWKKIRKKIKAIMVQEFKRRNLGAEWAKAKGSRPFTKRLQDRGADNITDGIVAAFRGQKGLTVKVQKGIRVKEGQSNSGRIQIGNKVDSKKKYRGVGTVPKSNIPTAAAKAAESPINLMALLNGKLPREVKANMTSPSLINRTGRFAGSVKVVNVVQNKKFPTIQYTYQRSPYGVFEDDPDRDPRGLINKTIREIASELMVGRFYTARV